MFSVIIPTYNNLNYLKICLKSLEKIQNTITKLLFILMKVLMAL